MLPIGPFEILLLLACSFVFWKGGTPERIAALTMVVGYILTISLMSPLTQRFLDMEFQVMLVDLAMLISFFALAIYAARFWTIWLCAMQVIQVLTHFPIMFIPELLPQAYAVVVAIWALPMIGLVVAGTIRHQQRIRRFGTDKSWNDS